MMCILIVIEKQRPILTSYVKGFRDKLPTRGTQLFITIFKFIGEMTCSSNF